METWCAVLQQSASHSFTSHLSATLHGHSSRLAGPAEHFLRERSESDAALLGILTVVVEEEESVTH